MRLLIIGPLNGHLGEASAIARQRGASVRHAESVAVAVDLLCAGKGADLIMVDVSLDVARLAEQLEASRISVPIVSCGVDAGPDAAVAAIKAGAKEYIPLPPDEELIAAVLQAIVDEDDSVITRSQAMRSILSLADQVAPSTANVLITGESGTGKEVVARYLHRKSKRAMHPFISVNCAAIPENLLESELFGHEKGAFTGATTRRIGKFEEASGGTLLLDEISEMDIGLQAKLLRAIQEKEIDRVGGASPVKVDLRILATSNRVLQQAVREGTFREDLLYRLNVINLHLPPLRERPDDIPLLAEHFVAKYCEANGLSLKSLTADAIGTLTSHRWPGNVRELENTLHRAVLIAAGERIGPEAIQFFGESAPRRASASPPPAGQGFTPLVGRSVAEVEQQLILETLDHCLGNRTHAATILGISIRTLRNKLKAYSQSGVKVPPPGEAERVLTPS